MRKTSSEVESDVKRDRLWMPRSRVLPGLRTSSKPLRLGMTWRIIDAIADDGAAK
jgi:hypothetical protein